MAQLKVYSHTPFHVYDERVKNILEEPRVQTRYCAWIAAYSKADAAQFAKDARLSHPSHSDLRVASSNDYEALLEASLFKEAGTVLVTSDRGGKRPVVQLGNPDGAQAIGVLRPADGRSGQVFEATMAQYAGRGSVAVGATMAYVKVDEDTWEGTKGDTPDDEGIQLLLDMGELNIIRSGFGDWYHAGR